MHYKKLSLWCGLCFSVWLPFFYLKYGPGGIWNSSAEIPSLPLVSFVVIRPKAHLTSHFRKSGSRWVMTPSWLSGLLRPFLYSYSVYSCYLFLISSTSFRYILFLSLIVPIFAWDVPLVSLIFLKRFLVFPILLFFPWTPKSLQIVTVAMKLKDACALKEKSWHT